MSFRNPFYLYYIYEDNKKIKNNKRYLRNISNYYDIYQQNNLYIKYFIDKKTKKRKDSYTLKLVPFTYNLKEYLSKIHKEDCHRNTQSL